MVTNAPKNSPRPIIRHTTAYVLVKVEAVADSDDFATHALCAVDAAVEGLDVPGATVLDVRTMPNDGLPTGVRHADTPAPACHARRLRPVVDCPTVPRKG